MRNLLSANFVRLRKNKALWVTCLICFVFSVFQVMTAALSVNVESAIEDGVYAEHFFMETVPMLGLFLGAFASLFLGTEHSDGTIRNKLSVGRTRSSIYLASYVSCLMGSVVLLVTWFIGASTFFLFSDLPLENGYPGLAQPLLLVMGVMMAFSAIYTVIGNLSSSKANTVIICFSVFMAMTLTASLLYDRLCEPEMNGGYSMLVDGEIVPVELTPNPLYISAPLRNVCQIILELIPTGQAILINNMDVIHPIRQFVFSLTVTSAAMFIGMIFFQKKDLK